MIPKSIRRHIGWLNRKAERYETIAASLRQLAAGLSNSFGDTLPRNPVAHPVDGRRPAETPGLAPPRPRTPALADADDGKVTRADHIEAIMRAAGRPMRIAELMDGLAERGQPGPTDRNVYSNSVNNTLKKNKDTRFYKYDDGRWFLVGVEPTEG